MSAILKYSLRTHCPMRTSTLTHYLQRFRYLIQQKPSTTFIKSTLLLDHMSQIAAHKLHIHVDLIHRAALVKPIVSYNQFGIDQIERLPLYLLKLQHKLLILPPLKHELLLDQRLLLQSIYQQSMTTEKPRLRTYLLDVVSFEQSYTLLRLRITHFIYIFINQLTHTNKPLNKEARSFVKQTLAPFPS